MNKVALERELEVDSVVWDMEPDYGYVRWHDTQVDTLRDNHPDELDRKYGFGEWLYVGRGNGVFGHRFMDKSPLANPFALNGRKPGSTSEDYRRWLWNKIKAKDEPVLRELHIVLHHKALVCHCMTGAPTCHAHTIIAAALWLETDAGTPYRIA